MSDLMSPDNRHKWALPYWARPGILTIKKGGDDSGGGDDDGDDDDDDDDSGDDDDEDADKSDEELRDELKAVRASLKAANGSSQRRRALLKEAKGKIDELEKRKPAVKKPADKADDTKPEVDVDAITSEAEERGRKAANKETILAKAETALMKAGVPDGKTARAAKLLDIDELDLRNGKVDGLEDAIEELKVDWPELFEKATPTKRRSVAGGSDRDGGGGPSKKLSATDRQAQMLFPGAKPATVREVVKT